jgi:hypothetical protein
MLRTMGVGLKEVRSKIHVKSEAPRKLTGLAIDLPLTPQAEQVLQIAYNIVRSFHQNNADPAHIFLALLDEPEGKAVFILRSLVANLDELRAQCVHHCKSVQERSAKAKEPKALDPAEHARQVANFRKTFLAEIGNIIRYSLGTNDALFMVVNIVAKVLRAHRCIAICSMDIGGPTQAFESSPYELFGRRTFKTSEQLGWPVSDSLLVLHLSQSLSPELLHDHDEDTGSPWLSELRMTQTKSLLGVPLRRNEYSLGCFILHQCDAVRIWDDDEIEFVVAVANKISDEFEKAKH